MLNRIHIHTKVEKTLDRMQAQDNAPKYAAQRAQTIIDRIIGGRCILEAGRFSQTRETRVKQVFKYNLGQGYRMVCIKEKDEFYILMIGTHDQCDRWLDSQAKKNPLTSPRPMRVYRVKPTPLDPVPLSSLHDPVPRDTAALQEISQHDLRQVFSGLAGH